MKFDPCFLRFRSAIAIILLIAGYVPARQTPVKIYGVVKDPAGAVVANATVSIIDAAGKEITVNTDKAGAYELKSLSSGKYSFSVSAQGFEIYNRDILITAQNQKIDISLSIAKHEDKIEVTDQTPGKVDTDPANNGNAIVLKEKDLAMLADDPDELTNQLKAMAGASVGGNGAQIYVDGFSGQRLPPKSAIREIRINQDPYSAEYDAPGFGRIEVFTKPGSQKFAGLISYRYNDAIFNSTSPFLSQNPSYHTHMVSADFGGPLTTRSSFQFGIDRNIINDNSVINALILDPSLSPVQFHQAVDNPRLATVASFRVDYQINSNNLLFARYQYFGKNEQNDGIGQFSLASQGFDFNSTDQTFQVSDTQFLSAKVINETRFQFTRITTDQTALSTATQILVPGAFIGGGNNPGNSAITLSNYEFQNYMSVDRGAQLLKFGARLRLASETNNSTPNFNGTFTFRSFDAFQITQEGLQQGLSPAQIRTNGGGAEQFTISSGNPIATNKLFDAGVFLQDDWKARPNLTFGLGLRYEVQNDIRTYGNFAPRVGFAWGIDPKKKNAAKSVLRVGWGVFYTRIPQSILLQAAQLNGINQQQVVVENPDFFPNVPSITNLSGSTTSPTIYQLDRNINIPYVLQTSVSFERSLPKSSKMAITYLNSRGDHQLLSTNINAPLPGTFDSNNPGSGVRPFPGAGNIYQFESVGKFEQNQLTINFSSDSLIRNVRLNGTYVLNYANSNTAGATSFLSNQFNIEQDYGRAAFDVRHQLNLGGHIDLPFGFYSDSFLLMSSGQPFNILISRDINGDSIFNDRPTFATDLSRPSVVQTRFGAFDTAPIPGQKIIPPNFGVGPNRVTFNVRLAKAFSLGNKEVSASTNSKSGNIYKNAWQPLYAIRFEVIANNVFNHPNLSTPTGNLSSPLFDKATGLAGSPYSSTAASRQVYLRAVFRF